MKATFFIIFIFTIVLSIQCSTSKPNQLDELSNRIEVKSYGSLKRMNHQKKTEGVIGIQQAVNSDNMYALGAIEHGLGEITVINSNVWLDYGKDGIGNSSNLITVGKKAVLLVTAKVPQWLRIKIPNSLSIDQLYSFILQQGKKHGLDINNPFPFLLEGNFDNLLIHVVNGLNKKLTAYKNKVHVFKKIRDKRDNQKGLVVGFYSANIKGVYTHPNKSWHLHIVIKAENIAAHVDNISVQKNTILKLPVISKPLQKEKNLQILKRK